MKDKINELKKEKLPELASNILPWKDGYIASETEEGEPQVKVLDKNLKTIGKLERFSAIKDAMIFQASPCPSNDAILAFMIQHPGAARPSVIVCDMEKGEILYESDGVFSFCWSSNDGCLYYSSTISNSESQESHSAFFKYDCEVEKETLVYEDKGFAIFGQVFDCHDGKYVMAAVCQDYSIAGWLAINTDSGEVAALTDHKVEWKYIDSLDDKHYFITMSEADNGAVIAVDNAEKAETVFAESDLILNNGFSCDNRIYIIAKKDVSSCLVSLETGKEVPLPSSFGALSISGKNKDAVFLKFESFTDAPRIIRFNGKSMVNAVLTTDKECPDVLVEQMFTVSNDGTRIPYYLVRKKNIPANGMNPVLMYAYGGYNISMQPWYTEMVTNTNIARWVDNGGIYVHCNLRGGDEYGPRWHKGGMGLEKRHCYEDFISIAEQLIKDGWTSKGRIGISGCSNGGLLMSALVIMRPDLWGCVIDSVPHTDMIHFAEDDRGPMYITEYGNPRESKEIFEYLLSYSPYHNIRRVDYPATYIQTGEMDNNVPPYHGKKFAARMQAENTSCNPILLRVLAEGSHDRGKGEAYWQTIAEMQLFLQKHLMEE